MKIKEENRKMINRLMEELYQELDTFIEPKDKFDAKAKYVELLWKISTTNINIELEDKDAIKEDISKELDESEELEDIAEEIDLEQEEEVEEIETEEEIIEEDKNIKENNPLNESEEVIYVTDEDNNTIDVTDIYNQVDFIEDREEREATALYITQAECMEEYEALDMLSHSDEKLYLASYMKIDLDYINECVNELSSGQSDNIFDFINNNNLEGFTQFLASKEE